MNNVLPTLKVTLFDNKIEVSTITNAFTLSAMAQLRNDIWGAFPFETAILKDTNGRREFTLVVKHTKSRKEALMNHNKIVNKLLKDRFKKSYWEEEAKKAYKRLINKK